MANVLCHPDDIRSFPMSSGWHNVSWFLCHPDEIAPRWLSYSQYLIRMTYRRCICHPDDLPGVGISSGWVTANSLCHPDDILFHFMSSGWLNWGWFLIRMSYGNVIMSSGWDTLPFLSHPDEIANFDFPQRAVALQRFRSSAIYLSRNMFVLHCSHSQVSTRDAALSHIRCRGISIHHDDLGQSAHIRVITT